MKRATFQNVVRISLAAFLSLFPLLIATPQVHAVPGSLNQQIFPLECVFQIVNDGSNTIIFVTPDECGVIVPPPPPPPPPPDPTDPNAGGGSTPIVPSNPSNPDGTILPPTVIQTGNGIIQTPGVFIPRGSGLNAARELPFEPVAVLDARDEVERTFGFAGQVDTTIAAVLVILTAVGLVVAILRL